MKWIERDLNTRNWYICGDFNQTEKVEDSVGPSPRMHGSEQRAWNQFVDKLDLSDNRLIVVLEFGPHLTRQAIHGEIFDQSRLDRSYYSEKGN